MRHRSPVQRLLLLSVLVLLVHLALLRSLPTALHLTQPADTAAALMFSARTLATPVPLPAVVRSPLGQAKTKPKPQPQPQQEPQQEPQQVQELGHAGQPEPSPPPPPSLPKLTPFVPLGAADAATPALQPPLLAAPAANAVHSPAEKESPSPDHIPNEPPPESPHPSASTALPLAFSSRQLSASTRLSYVVKTSKFPFPLRGELLWQNLGDTYHARLRYSILGQTRMQTSQGRITASGLAPERFADTYRSEVAAHFNYAQGKVSFSANTPDADLQPGAQDRLSVLVQLGALVASEPERFVPGSTLSLQTVGPRAADVWLFTVIQLETLDLPGGSVQGLRLERNPRQAYDQKVEIWLSPQLGYLPARVRITETNGDSIDQQWQSSSAADNPS